MKTVELQTQRAMLEIPENALKATLKFKVLYKGEVIEVKQKLSEEELNAAVEDAKENYCSPDDIFVLTEEGKRYADKN